jgi:hypothetical protein
MLSEIQSRFFKKVFLKGVFKSAHSPKKEISKRLGLGPLR